MSEFDRLKTEIFDILNRMREMQLHPQTYEKLILLQRAVIALEEV